MNGTIGLRDYLVRLATEPTALAAFVRDPDASARRIAGTTLSVEAAAEEAGYSSSAAFVRAFQREFGETPARWRRARALADDRRAGEAAEPERRKAS